MLTKYYKAELDGKILGVSSLERGTKDYACALIIQGYRGKGRVIVSWQWSREVAEEEAALLRTTAPEPIVTLVPAVRTDKATYLRASVQRQWGIAGL